MSDDEKRKKSQMTTVDKLKAQRDERKRLEELVIENQKDYQKALNDMAASPSGSLVLKTLIKACGVFDPKNGVDGVALIENNAKRNLYLCLLYTSDAADE